ncbi:hypothetical protein [Natrinema saccharevitans]|uniref:hypothetical protein n=1 Tax=Natrinema saccharevitans TaxID=301967 RepID=UPI001115781B|nr:hypothetical protein [Natrinema saccharevitans]
MRVDSPGRLEHTGTDCRPHSAAGDRRRWARSPKRPTTVFGYGRPMDGLEDGSLVFVVERGDDRPER